MDMVNPTQTEKKNKFLTRTVFICPLFGSPLELEESRLPTYEDIIRCCFRERYNLAPDKGNKEPSFTDIAENIAGNIEMIYDRANIPTVSHLRFTQMIHAHHKKFQCIMRNYKRDKEKSNFKNKSNDLAEEASNSLFNIDTCKCIDFATCSCEKSKKFQLKNACFFKIREFLESALLVVFMFLLHVHCKKSRKGTL
ncbi:hypothetical protein AVEN_237567-1 [Araneus ventricosus]|uniref:Uncharacterized protein n=1 Tax=Araneus ventricosus TaxID=182803 RepID=A0A4Y2KWR7_ARAVE|nr:hypothetical protein AVEN_237567-1 [Araneus ventricosus]